MPTTEDVPTGPAAGTGTAEPAETAAPDRTHVPKLSELDPVPLTGTAARPAPRPFGGGWDDGGRRPPSDRRTAERRTAEQDPTGQRTTGQDPTGRRTTGQKPDGQRPAQRYPIEQDPDGQRTADPDAGGYRVREPPTQPGGWPDGDRAADGRGGRGAGGHTGGRTSGGGRSGGGTAPVGGPPVDRARADGAGRAALVVAVLGLVASFLFFPLGLLVDVVALWLAARALGMARRSGAGRGRSGTAIGFGVAGVLLALVEIAVVLTFRTEIGEYIRCEQSAGTTSGQSACTERLQDAIADRMGVPAP